MQYIFTKKFDGTFTMSWISPPEEVSTQYRDVKTFAITPTKSITAITNFSDIIRGETDKHYFKKYENVKISVLKGAGHEKKKIMEYSDELLERLGKNYTSRIIGFTIVLKRWRKPVRE